MRRVRRYETANSLDRCIQDAGSIAGVLTPMSQLNQSYVSFGDDVINNISKLSLQFGHDWAMTYGSWKVYYQNNHESWTSQIGAAFHQAEIADELKIWEDKLKDFRRRYVEETSLAPTQGDSTLPIPPPKEETSNPIFGDPSKYTNLVVAIGALAAIVLIGPTLTRSFSHGT